MVSGVGHHGGPGSSQGGKDLKGKSCGGGLPPFLQSYMKDKKQGLTPGLAKMAENGKLPPGLAKKLDGEGHQGDENMGEEIRQGVENLKQGVMDGIENLKNTVSEGVDNLLSGLGLGSKTPEAKPVATQPTAPTVTTANTARTPVNTTSPFLGTLTPQQQNTLKTADSVLAKAASGATGGGGGLINPNATGPVLAPAVLGGGSVGIIPRGTDDPTRIIDNGVLTSLRAGDTAGFIGALAGNIQQSQNSAAVQFFRLTS